MHTCVCANIQTHVRPVRCGRSLFTTISSHPDTCTHLHPQRTGNFLVGSPPTFETLLDSVCVIFFPPLPLDCANLVLTSVLFSVFSKKKKKQHKYEHIFSHPSQPHYHLGLCGVLVSRLALKTPGFYVHAADRWWVRGAFYC